MNWDDLRIFIAVARAGQIARAAAALGMDATTVSRRLRRLERDRGEILFGRLRDGQQLTEAGARLVEMAETIDQSFQRLSERDGAATRPNGLLRVSASEGFGTWFIARHMSAFAAEYPDVHVDLVANSGFLSPSKRETDMAILLARPRKGPLVTRKLTDYRLRLYASRSYLKHAPPVVIPADLKKHRLIGYIPDLIYAPELHYLNEVLEGLEPHYRSSSINAQQQLAKGGLGIAILPHFIGDIDDELERVLPDISILRSFWLAIHEDMLGFRRTRCFVDWLAEVTHASRSLLLGAM